MASNKKEIGAFVKPTKPKQTGTSQTDVILSHTSVDHLYTEGCLIIAFRQHETFIFTIHSNLYVNNAQK